MESTLKRTWSEIDLDALIYNYKKIREKIGEGVKFLGVVKADAYGCGAIRFAQKLRELGFKWFATATLGEAVELKTNGFENEEVIVLGLSSPMNAATNTFRGISNTSMGVPTCSMYPSCMITMRSPRVMASV